MCGELCGELWGGCVQAVVIPSVVHAKWKYCVPLSSSECHDSNLTIVSWQHVTATVWQTVWQTVWRTKLYPTMLWSMPQKVGETRGTLVWYASGHGPCHMQTELSCERNCSCKCRQQVRLWFFSRAIQQSPLMDLNFPFDCGFDWCLDAFLIESSYGSPSLPPVCLDSDKRLDTTGHHSNAMILDIPHSNVFFQSYYHMIACSTRCVIGTRIPRPLQLS